MVQITIEHSQSKCIDGDLLRESQRQTMDEMNAREKMVADRREQQRLRILRNLVCRH